MAKVETPSHASARQPGRPSIYSEALADEICERLACGESLRRICGDSHMPDKATVIRWLAKNAAFHEAYSSAREIQKHVWFDEMVDLSRSEPARDPVTGGYDPAAVRHIRNQVGTLQWIMQKLNPPPPDPKLKQR